MLFASIAISAFLAFLPQIPDTLDVAKVTDTRDITLSGSVPAQRIGSMQLQRSGAISLTEALRTFSGLSVKDYGGIGGMKTVSIRSFGSQHTSIVYDGQLLSDAQNGQVDISRFNLDNVRSVAVEIGGTDDIFRQARLASSAGVLMLDSARPVFDSTGTRVSVQLRHGSFGTWNPYFSITQRITDNWSLTLWADHVSSKGNYPFLLHNGDLVTIERRLHSDVSSLNTEATLYGTIGKTGTLKLKASLFDSERGLPGSVILYTQNPEQRLWDRDFKTSFLYNAAISQRISLKAGGSFGRAWNRYVDYDPIRPEPEDERFLQKEGTAWAVALFQPLAALQFSLAQDLVLNTLDSNLPGCPFPTRLASYTAVSARYAHAALSATASLLATSTRDRVQKGGAFPAWRHLSPSGSISLAFNENLTGRLSYKDSFRLPTFNDLYYQRIGNSNLRPEHARQLNAGLSWSRSSGSQVLAASADGYFNSVRDRLVAVPSMFAWSMRNVGKVQMLGSDLSLRWRAGVTSFLTVQASAAYAYQYVVDVTDPDAKNYRHQIAYTPRHSGSASLTVESPWVDMGWTMQAVGERFTLAQNIPAYRTEPYCDHMLSLNRTFGMGKAHPWKLRVSAEALNLTGRNYEVIKFYPMPGRNYRLTIKLTY